jgi:hypothetical protein
MAAFFFSFKPHLTEACDEPWGIVLRFQIEITGPKLAGARTRFRRACV